MSHTPGPWVRTYGNCIHVLGTGKEGHAVNRMHLTVHGGWTNGERTTEEEINATAQLIAAAPALADAVADLLAVMDMQERRGNMANVTFGCWSDPRARAEYALRAAGRINQDALKAPTDAMSVHDPSTDDRIE